MRKRGERPGDDDESTYSEVGIGLGGRGFESACGAEGGRLCACGCERTFEFAPYAPVLVDMLYGSRVERESSEAMTDPASGFRAVRASFLAMLASFPRAQYSERVRGLKGEELRTPFELTLTGHSRSLLSSNAPSAGLMPVLVIT